MKKINFEKFTDRRIENSNTIKGGHTGSKRRTKKRKANIKRKLQESW